jgi:hypothetical protein
LDIDDDGFWTNQQGSLELANLEALTEKNLHRWFCAKLSVNIALAVGFAPANLVNPTLAHIASNSSPVALKTNNERII